MATLKKKIFHSTLLLTGWFIPTASQTLTLLSGTVECASSSNAHAFLTCYNKMSKVCFAKLGSNVFFLSPVSKLLPNV